MSRLTSCLLLLLPLASLAEGEQAAAPSKVAVLPFAALSGEVPSRAGLKAAGMLSTEFKNAEGVQLIDVRKGGAAADPHADGLVAARKSVDEARELRKKKKFRLSDEALKAAVESYKKSAAGLTDVSEVIDALALQAAVQFNTGRDEDGQKSLANALAMAPDRELPLASTSALFARVVADTRKAVKDAPRGTLQLETTPSGAAVMIDGLALGGTPLQVKDVPVGLHFWRASLANGESLGGVVDVASGKTTKVTAASTTKDPESRLLSSLSQNRLDSDLVAAAREIATAGGADWLVFGSLSKEGKGLTLDAFLFTQAGELRRLPRASFDTELLSAGMEFYAMAGAVQQKGAKVGDAVKVPSAVSSTLPPGGVKLAEAKYGVQPGKELDLGLDPVEAGKDDGPRKPAVPEKRKPLKK